MADKITVNDFFTDRRYNKPLTPQTSSRSLWFSHHFCRRSEFSSDPVCSNILISIQLPEWVGFKM